MGDFLMMTPRERILAVYEGRQPDRVPYMLDLSHYYLHRFQMPWDLCNGYNEPDTGMIEFNRSMGAAFYMPNQAIFYRTEHANDVKCSVQTRSVNGVPEIAWRYDTPIGSIERVRVWNKNTYSWPIKKWGVVTEQDIRVLAYAMGSRRLIPLPEKYDAWADAVGDDGVVYLGSGYSAMGYFMSYWMGVENTIYAMDDYEDLMQEAFQTINDNNLEQVRILASEFKAPVILMGDNISSDVQPPSLFDQWSRDYYVKACGIFHAHGKKVAVHVDGRLKGALSMVRDAGADAIDAVTPGTVGRLTPAQARAEAGNKLILSGGIPNQLWYPQHADMAEFEQAVKDWLALKEVSPALISAAGDQVPPGADEARIRRMGELVEEFGWY